MVHAFYLLSKTTLILLLCAQVKLKVCRSLLILDQGLACFCVGNSFVKLRLNSQIHL